jgi:hypothetical protein
MIKRASRSGSIILHVSTDFSKLPIDLNTDKMDWKRQATFQTLLFNVSMWNYFHTFMGSLHLITVSSSGSA